MSKRAKAKPRTCHDCTYAVWDRALWMRTLASGFGARPTCANHPDSSGKMRETPLGGTCAHFRAKRKPRPPLIRKEPPEPPSDDVRYIPLTRGLFATVDASDYEWLSKHKWCARCDVDGKRFYACRSDHGRMVLMHREIMQPPAGMVVDHINGDGLNDRRCNMRICTRRQNARNTRRVPGQSGFIGVYRRGEKWSAELRHDGRDYYLGLFDDPIEAAKARDQKALELDPEFIQLNFPTAPS